MKRYSLWPLIATCLLANMLISGPFPASRESSFAEDQKSEEQSKELKGYKECADLGNIHCRFYVGLMYFLGRGVTKNYTEASNWFRLTADQGHASAQHFLGMMYESGSGVAQDFAEASKWYRKSADLGNALDQYYLGRMFETGKGVAQDYSEAIKWYKKAADQGYALAQYYLGVMYEKGRGVTQDYVLAHMWINLSSAELGDYGSERSVTTLDALEKKMTGQQIAEARRLAREWKMVKP